MTGIETGLLILLAGVVGVTGGKMWGIKTVETKFLPRVEHDLGCANMQLRRDKALIQMKEDIIEAIKNNGKCSQCQGDSPHPSQ